VLFDPRCFRFIVTIRISAQSRVESSRQMVDLHRLENAGDAVFGTSNNSSYKVNKEM
jgi:hypothetical protein